jgi:hypothetical protein
MLNEIGVQSKVSVDRMFQLPTKKINRAGVASFQN